MLAAEQMDVHEGTATVREALQFSAYLRQPEHVPRDEKDAYVEEMLELLELQDLDLESTNSLVDCSGNPGQNIKNIPAAPSGGP